MGLGYGTTSGRDQCTPHWRLGVVEDCPLGSEKAGGGLRSCPNVSLHSCIHAYCLDHLFNLSLSPLNFALFESELAETRAQGHLA